MGYQKQTPSGDTYTVPEQGDPNWGANATAILDRSLDSLTAGDTIVATEIIITPVPVTVANGDTLIQTNTSFVYLTVSGAQDVTLSSITPIEIPNADGKQLLIVNTDPTYVVTIPDSGTTDINGGVTLGLNQSIKVVWLAAVGKWVEQDRNN